MGASKKILAGVVWSILTNIFNALYGFIMIPILIRYFGKAEYGLIGLAMSVNAYMQLMDMGLTSTNVRFFSNWLAKGDTEKVRRLFSTCTAFYGCVGIINAIVLFIVYLFSDSIFNVTPEQGMILKKLLLILAAAAIVNWTTSCYNQIIQATENVAWTQKRLLITKILMVVVLLITILGHLNIVEYFLLTVLCNWIILPWVIKKIKEVAPMVSFKAFFDKAVFKEILPYSLNIFSFTIFSFSYKNLRTVFIGMRGNVESVTDFQVIMGIVGICAAVSGVFTSVLLPSSSKAIAQNDRDTYYRIAYQGTKYITLFTYFCVFGMLTVAKELLVLYVGEDFLYLMPALSIMLLTLLGNHILGISSLILGGENIRPLAIITAFSSTASLLACWILIPQYQVLGVAIAAAVYEVSQMSFYYLYYFPRIMKIDPWKLLRTIVIPILLFGSIAYYLTQLIPNFNNHVINVIIWGIGFAVIYSIAGYFYLDKTDKQFIISLIKHRGKK